MLKTAKARPEGAMPLRAKHQSKTVQRDQRSVRASGGLTHHGRSFARAENAVPRPSRQVLDRKRRGYAGSQAPSKQASWERAWGGRVPGVK